MIVWKGLYLCKTLFLAINQQQKGEEQRTLPLPQIQCKYNLFLFNN